MLDQTNEKRVASSPVKTLRDLLEKSKHQMALALPTHLKPERMIRVAMTAFMKTPQLQKCTAHSIVACVVQSSELGLELTGPLGHAYMVPYWNKNTKQTEAQFQVGYRGFIELAFRSGKVTVFSSRCVYANDRFKVRLGTDPRIDHEPTMDDPGEVVAVYSVVKMAGGGEDFEVMSRKQIEDHRTRYSKQDRDGAYNPWNTAWEEMAKKGLALDTPIPTPTGWSTMGNLEKGDWVFDGNGEPSRVRAVSAIKNIECYRVSFSNGDSIVCDDEHRWPATIGRNGARYRRLHGWPVYTVNELFNAKRNGEIISVPVIESLKTEQTPLRIAPWLLGYWLGDGHEKEARITCNDDDVEEIKELISATPYTIGSVRHDPRSKAVCVGISGGFRSDLRSSALLGNKHLPNEYLRASERDRRAALCVLMDSDGCIEKHRGRAIFANTNRGLSDAVAELAASVGEVAHRASRFCAGFGKSVLTHFVSWQPKIAPVILARKKEHFRPRKIDAYKSIVAIKKVASVPTKCIAVESATLTFLAGKSMVVTHNTPMRRLSKRVPLSVELVKAAVIDEYGEAGIGHDDMPNLDAPRASAQESLDKLNAQPERNGNGANGHANPAPLGSKEMAQKIRKFLADHYANEMNMPSEILKRYKKHDFGELTAAEQQEVLDGLNAETAAAQDDKQWGRHWLTIQ